MLISKFGKLDIMHNNVGMKLTVRVMIPSRYGSIVAMASICGRIGSVALQTYMSSKHNIVELVRNAVVDLGPLRIRVNIVSPYE
ncbi:hypothetical protein JHK82_031161 [Glycine max]|uniref:Xanthoxin dehydrogenase n=1 Tax=Glycine soja TaxID=3848 RepID=A0A0B2QI68_GLYSO|nr:hypothetical protein JHK87_031084 [Glycine soja]KAG4988825.1 hypothetical protein JHK85_031808 [Glycine max]KAG5124424.1 hypothetical protein JHK82_031161 [Glycine max]KHN19909.1 Xanthoxin dehydrogenase [Glycine soja]